MLQPVLDQLGIGEWTMCPGHLQEISMSGASSLAQEAGCMWKRRNHRMWAVAGASGIHMPPLACLSARLPLGLLCVPGVGQGQKPELPALP